MIGISPPFFFSAAQNSFFFSGPQIALAGGSLLIFIAFFMLGHG
jgi:hypothetical protein